MYRPVHSAAARESRVRRIDNGISFNVRDIALFNADHFSAERCHTEFYRAQRT